MNNALWQKGSKQICVDTIKLCKAKWQKKIKVFTGHRYTPILVPSALQLHARVVMMMMIKPLFKCHKILAHYSTNWGH